MTTEQESPEMTEARVKFGRVLEIYSPRGPGRDNAVKAMAAATVEFEAAIRSDERARCAHHEADIAHRANEVSAREHNAAVATQVAETAARSAEAAVIAHDAAVLAGQGVEVVVHGDVSVPGTVEPVADMQPKFDAANPPPAPDVFSAQPHAPAPTAALTANEPAEAKSKKKSK